SEEDDYFAVDLTTFLKQLKMLNGTVVTSDQNTPNASTSSNSVSRAVSRQQSPSDDLLEESRLQQQHQPRRQSISLNAGRTNAPFPSNYQALVEETRCEIVQLERPRTNITTISSSSSAHQGNGSGIAMIINTSGGGNNSIHRKLLRDASPFLFPCTIEFSLICAVILYEMWRRIDERRCNKEAKGYLLPSSPTVVATCDYVTQRSTHQLSIDCGSAHRGLFGGVLVVAATVLSLIMFFVLKEAKPQMAVQQVTLLEVAIQIS
ncbi:uncharacterized protein LOC106646135, partial [Copidosoma floridanum]|uniref:uncharacterized protein LOC106646135 n=1 Tax=Copidosoma floridanum TaxID=29053 RepID=UPI0006C9B5B8